MTVDGTAPRVLVDWAARELSAAGVDSPAADARALVEWACGADSLWSAPPLLAPEEVERLRGAVSARARRVPLQHITGRMHFRSLALRAAPGVFVVRPETECVAQAAIDRARTAVGRRGSATVVDLCSGSGAIAIAVATEVPGCRVWAVEADGAAARLAASNIGALAPGRVELLLADATDGAALAHLDGSADVVVSNPPYVPADEMPDQPEALADPAGALYGGSPDGTAVPRLVARRALGLLAPGGALVMEHSPSQSAAMRRAAESLGYCCASTHRDLAGRDRYLVAERPGVTQ